MKYLATTRGRRFTRRTVEKLCGIDNKQSRILRAFKEVEVTEAQGELLQKNNLALPVLDRLPEPKVIDEPKPAKKSKNNRKNIKKEDSDVI